MMRPISLPTSAWILSGTLLASRVVLGQGSVITNTLPPGGEGAASVALGVALPGGPGSMEVNPALLAWEGERTQSLVQYSDIETETKSMLFDAGGNRIPGSFAVTPEKVHSLGIRYPHGPGTDVALGYSWHGYEMTPRAQMNELGDSIGTFQPEEEVHHFVLAGRFGGIASVGLGWRWLDSRLAEFKDSAGNVHGSGTASTWNLGLRLAPTWRVPATPLRLTPSLGMSWITLGEDSISYGEDRHGTFSPIERVRRWGVALTATVPDLVTGEVFLDDETNLSVADWRFSSGYEGWSLEALGLVRWSSADFKASRSAEVTTRESIQYILDAKNLWRLYTRLRTGKLLSADLVDMEAYPLPGWSVLGVSFAPNVRFTWTRSETTSESVGWIRQSQDRIGWALSL